MMENLMEEQPEKLQRPTSLLVICILTFIGSGWGVLSNLFSMFLSSVLDSSIQMEQYSDMLGDIENGNYPSFFAGIINSSMEIWRITFTHARQIATMHLVLSVISLLGAVMMFQLRRWGFYLYVVAQLLTLFILPYFAGFTFLVVLAMLWDALWAAIFIIMYAINLKYMR